MIRMWSFVIQLKSLKEWTGTNCSKISIMKMSMALPEYVETAVVLDERIFVLFGTNAHFNGAKPARILSLGPELSQTGGLDPT